jgi:hypothetical protein
MEYYPPGRVLSAVVDDCLEAPGLTITPVTVSHGSADLSPAGGWMPCCAAFVVQREGGKKVVLLWDIDNQNLNWMRSPSEETTQAVSLLSGADLLFVDANCWSAEEADGKPTGHTAFTSVMQIAEFLRPRQTRLVHLSGHEDGEGNPGWGWLDDMWQHPAQSAWQARQLPGGIAVPRIGEAYEI